MFFPAVTVCDDSCFAFQKNGVCNDGAYGHVTDDCDLGTDCSDCSARCMRVAPESTTEKSTTTEEFTMEPDMRKEDYSLYSYSSSYFSSTFYSYFSSSDEDDSSSYISSSYFSSSYFSSYFSSSSEKDEESEKKDEQSEPEWRKKINVLNLWMLTFLGGTKLRGKNSL